MKIEPYLFFEGRCEEAIEFYKAALGAEVSTLMRFKDAPQGGEGQPTSRPELAEKIMHASLAIGGTQVLVSDGIAAGEAKFAGFCLTITAPDDAATEQFFAAISEGGKVKQPLMTTFFASKFGMTEDKFGVGWIVLTGP